ncbi:FAD/NAD(P)-binding protein [Terrabacter sp. BE26]|uniref:FAD/NAD(P)-binding protein n=1 Tax=Terrabacter sp. BE26 TaxID=2898152 RepID=UPI0035BE537A
MQVSHPTRPTVAVLGAGASGTLAAIHLLRTAGRRATPVDLVLLDPADRWGRGVAFGTADEAHLLNVTAAGMSAIPEDPGHFVDWLARQDPDGRSEQGAFVPRRQFALYLDDTLADAVASTYGLVSLRHRRVRGVSVRRTVPGVEIGLADGSQMRADAVVVATGLPAVGHGWAPPALRDSPFFVPDPWLPGALDVVRRDRTGPPDVLVVGTGLTMVDVVRSITADDCRADRLVHAVSRHARLPEPHTEDQKLAAIPDIAEWGQTLAELRADVDRHVSGVVESTGDWRPAVDGLRHQVAALWGRLSEADRVRFLAEDAGAWNVARHRMPPASARVIARLRSSGRLQVTGGEVAAAEPLPAGGLSVTLSDGTQREVGWVVNCTGPQSDVRALGDSLVDDLLRTRGGVAAATPATAGMGFRTAAGRLVDSAGTTEAPIWTLGALRRGELWESTAVPEIRAQARAIGTAVLDAVAPQPRRLADGRLVSGHHPVARPRDPLGLPLSTTAEAAAA